MNMLITGYFIGSVTSVIGITMVTINFCRPGSYDLASPLRRYGFPIAVAGVVTTVLSVLVALVHAFLVLP